MFNLPRLSCPTKLLFFSFLITVVTRAVSATYSMSWNTELAYFVTPKSGPMRPMRTLVDVNRALLDDLPFVSRLRPHWAAVARLLLIASDTGSTIDVRLATDALVRAQIGRAHV